MDIKKAKEARVIIDKLKAEKKTYLERRADVSRDLDAMVDNGEDHLFYRETLPSKLCKELKKSGYIVEVNIDHTTLIKVPSICDCGENLQYEGMCWYDSEIDPEEGKDCTCCLECRKRCSEAI